MLGLVVDCVGVSTFLSSEVHGLTSILASPAFPSQGENLGLPVGRYVETFVRTGFG